MIVHLLYFDNCPSWQTALANLHTVIQEENLNAVVRLVEVISEKEAEAYEFLGSPSFQINGEDLWPEARQKFLLSCRVYHTSEGLKGWPTVAMLRQRLNEKA